MNIWFLTVEYVDETTGGIARYVETCARLFVQAGHTVVIFACALTDEERELLPGLFLIKRAIKKMPPRELSAHLADTVHDALSRFPSPDIIETQENKGIAFTLIKQKREHNKALMRIPIIVHLHSPVFMLGPMNQDPVFELRREDIETIERFCISHADGLVSPSHFLAAEIQRILGLDLAINVIPLPLPRFICENTQMRSHGYGVNDLLCVARLEPRKGQLRLVDACAHLWQLGEQFTLTLIGPDRIFSAGKPSVGTILKARHSRWIEEGKLIILGELPYDEALQHVAEASIIVMPSLWDNFPNTCMEAMMFGKVVITSTAGGQVEMIDAGGTCGVTFSWDIDDDCERAIRQVFAMNADERERMGNNAQQRIITLCDPERNLKMRLKQYEDIINRPG